MELPGFKYRLLLATSVFWLVFTYYFIMFAPFHFLLHPLNESEIKIKKPSGLSFQGTAISLVVLKSPVHCPMRPDTEWSLRRAAGSHPGARPRSYSREATLARAVSRHPAQFSPPPHICVLALRHIIKTSSLFRVFILLEILEDQN